MRRARDDVYLDLTSHLCARFFVQLDDDIMTNDPPWAAIRGFNTRDFVSSRIGCYVYPPGLAIGLDYAAACLK